MYLIVWLRILSRYELIDNYIEISTQTTTDTADILFPISTCNM